MTVRKLKKHVIVKVMIFFSLFIFMMPEFFAFLPNYGYFLILIQLIIISLLVFLGRFDRKDAHNLRFFLWLIIVNQLFVFVSSLSQNIDQFSIIKQQIGILLPFYFAFAIYVFVTSKDELRMIVTILLSIVIIQLSFGVIELLAGNPSLSEKIFPQLAALKSITGVLSRGERNIVSSIFGLSNTSKFIFGATSSNVFYAHILLFSPMFFLIYSFKSIKPIKYDMRFVLLLLLNITITYFTFIRGTLLAVIILSLLYLNNHIFKGVKSYILFLQIILVILLFSFFFGSIFADYFILTQNFSSRYSYWVDYLNSFRDLNFINILGGTHDYSNISLNYGRAAHNSFIILLVDKGLIFISILVLLLVKAIRTRTNSKLVLSVKYTLGIIIFSQMFDNMLADNTFIQVYWYTFIVITLLTTKINRNEIRVNFAKNTETPKKFD